MPLLATGDYRPDVGDYEGQATRNILNVVPRGDGYGPFSGFFGLFFGAAIGHLSRRILCSQEIRRHGYHLSPALPRSLYQLNNTNFSWTDVSLGGGTYGALSVDR